MSAEPTRAPPGQRLPSWLVRTWALARRETLRVVRRPNNTILPSIVTNGLYVTVFGVVLGARIGDVTFGGGGTVPYIQFVIPGLIALGTISQSFQNASFTVFHGRWEEYIDSVVASPLGHREQVTAYLIASGVRGLSVAVVIFLLGLAFTRVPVQHPVVGVAFLLLVVTLFGSLGVVGGLWADDFDQLTVFNQFMLRPLVFFGGVFYPLSDLQGPLLAASYANPMVYIVSGIRYGLLGESAVPPFTALAVLAGAAAVSVAVVLTLIRRGYGLRT